MKKKVFRERYYGEESKVGKTENAIKEKEEPKKRGRKSVKSDK